MMDFGNSGLGVHDSIMNAGDDYVGVYCKFDLEADGWQWSCRSEGTHVEDVKNPVEVQPPGGYLLPIVPRVEQSRGHISFASLGDVPLDFCHSPAIQGLVNRSPSACMTGPTHVVNCSIASSTDRLTSCARLPFIPRSRALQTSAQASPRST